MHCNLCSSDCILHTSKLHPLCCRKGFGCCRPSSPSTTRMKAWLVLLVVCWTHYQWVSDPNRAAICHHSLQKIYRCSQGLDGLQFGSESWFLIPSTFQPSTFDNDSKNKGEYKSPKFAFKCRLGSSGLGMWSRCLPKDFQRHQMGTSDRPRSNSWLTWSLGRKRGSGLDVQGCRFQLLSPWPLLFKQQKTDESTFFVSAHIV